LHNNTTRLASANNVARPNNPERAFPFIASSRALAGPTSAIPDSERRGGEGRPKRSSTQLNFADKGLIETRGKLRPTTQAF
jgi:hypothetical protein